MATFAHTLEMNPARLNLPGVDSSGKPSLKRALGDSSAHTDLVRQVAPVTVARLVSPSSVLCCASLGVQ
jgi:hypothetical protein